MGNRRGFFGEVMQSRNAVIARWCLANDLPDDAEFRSAFIDTDGKFPADEGDLWDFKAEWPFSHSNAYWGGISRLICAFSNTSGGVIVFGVDDTKRTGGHNSVSINIDRLLQSFHQLTDERPRYCVRTYSDMGGGEVTALLISPRLPTSRPFRFKKGVEKYPAGIFWVRDGHEVVRATPAHYPMLFCRSQAGSSEANTADVAGSLPPSPTTLKRFVGRSSVLDHLFAWIILADEPRTFLHGKGGSGKTSIAYEFAKLLKEHGSGIRLYGNMPIESVVFLSAKERELQISTGEVAEIPDPDFASERELYEKILTYGGWTTSSLVEVMDIPALKAEIVEYLDMLSVVLVIDDVDTLTTKGVDAGFDFLYRTLARCNSGSKVLYTLRNAPTQSLLNSIEVPGLEQGGEYEEFVTACASQFSVEPPRDEFRDNDLAQQSERRPLVIESIVALRRTCGSYKRAKDLFDQHAGADVRDYVFSREWDSLPADNLGRLLLIALAQLGRPASFSEIETILQVDSSRIMDAVGATREMFLQVDNAGDESVYALAELTRRFVLGKRDAVTGSNVIRERISTFKRHAFTAGPEVAQIVVRVDRLVRGRGEDLTPENARSAWELVDDPALEPRVTEDPIFRSLKGHVAAVQRPPKLTDARENFAYAMSMKFEPEFYRLKEWYFAEKAVSEHGDHLDRITDFVVGGRKYKASERIFMLQKKAGNRYFRGKQRIYTDPTDARNDLIEAVKLHLRVFRMAAEGEQKIGSGSTDHAKNTAYTLFDLIVGGTTPWELPDAVRELAAVRDIYLDPAAIPLEEALQRLSRASARPDLAHRVYNRLKGLDALLSTPQLWLDRNLAGRISEAARSTAKSLKPAGK